jgi:hypothetical protein
MPWTLDRWPPSKAETIDVDLIINEVRAALVERNDLVPAGWVPRAFLRWDRLAGTPSGGTPQPVATMANFQFEIQEMLGLVWPLRWWDSQREDLYTLSHLCQDAFGRAGWTVDLTAKDEQNNPINRWTPPYAVLFQELHGTINRLDRVRILPTLSESVRRDSVYQLTFGISNWPQDRAAAFALFDGQDDGQTVSLDYDVGMGGQVDDSGSMVQWTLESRQFRMEFATMALDGVSVRRAWLDFTTAAPAGSPDFEAAFTAQVLEGDGTLLGTFASTAGGTHRIEIPAASVHTDADTELVIRSAQADTADRTAWTPGGPDYTSTYREGLAVAGPIRLIVEIDFEYHG